MRVVILRAAFWSIAARRISLYHPMRMVILKPTLSILVG